MRKYEGKNPQTIQLNHRGIQTNQGNSSTTIDKLHMWYLFCRKLD